MDKGCAFAIRFAKAIDLGDVFALSEVFGNAGLVPVGDAPGEAFSNSLRGPFDQIHGAGV